MTTIHASGSAASARYYTHYLAQDGPESEGRWSGRQAGELGLAGTVETADLEALLSGHDPVSGQRLGRALVDRLDRHGHAIPAVAGFDATFSAPKSLSVWWALTGDPGLVEAHDTAVAAVLAHLERYGATTRVRVGGGRQHPDTLGLAMATFGQVTSREDDPQLHTHVVISAKVRTADGRWLALDARYLKGHQRALGGLYQSVLRAELSRRYGVTWDPIVNGQAEIAGTPADLLDAFSKRTAQVDAALAAKLHAFRQREGRDPTRWERAAITREAAADSRSTKTGAPVAALAGRWRAEAAELGWTPARLVDQLQAAARRAPTVEPPTLAQVLDRLSTNGSTWTRADVLQAVCDLTPAVSHVPGARWAASLERAADRVVEHCTSLDPPVAGGATRASDGRSLWLAPTEAYLTDEGVLAQEERILAFALDAHAEPARPSATVERRGLDVLQAAAAASVAGSDRLVVVVGPAGTGKTTAMAAAVADLRAQGRPVFGVAPTAKAAHVLGRETGIDADTVAKVLHEWSRPRRSPLPAYRLPSGATLIVDEAGMVGTASLARLVDLAESQRWRLVLVGDAAQLQAVGRGGLFAELCATVPVHELASIHRFAHPWEAAASTRLRAGDPAVLDAYQAHGRIRAGTLDEHVAAIAAAWPGLATRGTVAVVATTNDHVDLLNHAIQQARLPAGHLDATRFAVVGGDELVHPGDWVATRRNDRTLATSRGHAVHNRDLWTVDRVHDDGALTVTHRHGHGTVTLPADYAARHVRLGYAATEHAHQGETVDLALSLVSDATTQRGLYVAATRGRHHNRLHVVTDTPDPAVARDTLEAVLTRHRSDIPAVTQRRHLARQTPAPTPTPRAPIPHWLPDAVAALHDRCDELRAQHDAHQQARQRAANECAELEPVLSASRAAWRPYADRIDAITVDLNQNLRPAMWAANRHAMHARFGHRHATRRRAADATQAVADAERRIAAIHTDGAAVKERLDALTATAANLNDRARPYGSLDILDRYTRRDLDQTERLLDALTNWERWASGRTIAARDLVDSVATLADAACDAPHHSPGQTEFTHDRYSELLENAGIELRRLGFEHQVQHSVADIGRDGVGLEL